MFLLFFCSCPEYLPGQACAVVSRFARILPPHNFLSEGAGRAPPLVLSRFVSSLLSSRDGARTARADHVQILYSYLLIQILKGRNVPDMYDMYDLYDLAHVAGWDRYNLRDLLSDMFSVGWACTSFSSTHVLQNIS